MPESDDVSIRVVIARFEGKLDAWSLQQARHEERLNTHSTKLDALQTQVTEVATRVSSANEARRYSPSWPTVVSAIVAVVTTVLLIATQLQGGN